MAARSELTLLEGNPNQGDVAAVAGSLRRFGQKTPIVVTPEGVVVKGNTTVQAADLLVAEGLDEWAELWVVDDEEDDVGEQLAYALADNRTGRLGEDDPALTLAMWDRIPDHTGIGYDSGDIADLRAASLDRHGATARIEWLAPRTTYFAPGGIQAELGGKDERQADNTEALTEIAAKWPGRVRLVEKAGGVTSLRFRTTKPRARIPRAILEEAAGVGA